MPNQSQASPLPENLAEEEEEEEVQQQQQEDQKEEEEEDKKLQEASQEPTGGGGDERKVATLPPSAQKTSPILKPCAANATGSGRIILKLPRRRLGLKFTDFYFKSLQASKNLDSPRLPLGTPDKRPFENSAKDGVSQGKEKKIKDKVHGEDGEEGEEGEGEDEAGGEENPRDDSASI